MKNFKFLPIWAVSLGLIVSAAAVASAQDTATSTDQPAASEQPVSKQDGARGDRKGRDGHGSHHRKGKHKGGMGRHHGGSEMFRTLFGQVDADGNGAVTQEEIDNFRAAKVGEADASGDGALSIEEFDTLYREFTRSRMVDMFQKMDADGDGVISDAEMDSRFGGVVDRMDRDDDGALTLKERGRRG